MKIKKLLLSVILFISIFVLAGCEKTEEQGNYKEGTYFGHVIDDYGNANNLATAIIYVDKNGMIKSVFADTVYMKDDTNTTKKALGTDYGMKDFSDAGKEWYEQVNIIEEKVIEEQGLDWLKLNDDGKTDAVSGVTMKVNAIYKAIDSALTQAKK